MPRTMIIDTDTASDDAVALIMALQHPDVDVRAITIVAGNMPVSQASKNARAVVELCGKSTPVYNGAEVPLLRPAYRADWFHGPDGMSEMWLEPATPAAPGHAVDAMIETIKANPGIILVTLGPLTNVALAVSRAPEIVPLVSRCVVMGGAACVVGNITPAAEYNIWCDPEAARIVFRNGLPVEMVGWELCRYDANLNPDEVRYVKEQINTPIAHFAMDCNRIAVEANIRQNGDPGMGLPDPIAMAIALDPAVASKKSKHYVEIECSGEFTRGMTVVDQLYNLGHTLDEMGNVPEWKPLVAKGEPHISVCWSIDVQRWKTLLYQLLA